MGNVSEQQPVVLTDGTITLRAWRPEDWRAVFDACQDEQIARFAPIPLPYTEESAQGFISMCEDEWATGRERPFAITDTPTGEVVGSITRHAPWGHRVEFGYWVAPGARGRGVATRALRLLADWTLDTTDLIRLDLYTHPDNHASGRVALGAGFVREGVRRAWDLDREGRPEDAIFYVLVREP
jgi:RimJ/RimL family protein N-acetyltransferase